MTDEALTANNDEGSLWDELSHQHSREIQQHQYWVASSRSSQGASIRSTLQNAAAVVSSAASDVASAAAAAASAAAQRRRHQRYRGVPANDPSARVTCAGADAALAEFGLHPASSTVSAMGGAHDSGGYQPPSGGGGGAESPPVPGTASQTKQVDQRPKLSAIGDPQRSGMGGSFLEESKNNNFVFLNKFRLGSNGEGWGAVSNLDLFFTSIYNYYYHRGIVPIIGKGVVEIISLFFCLWLSVFLFAYLDWGALATCTDETTCHTDFRSYIIEKPFSKLSLWNTLVILYCITFTCYGVFALVTFIATLRDALEAKTFFEDKLGISSRKLEGGAVEWDEVVQKIVALQESREYRVAIHGQKINALTVAQIIMRKENFMVAFINRNMLDLSLPLPWLQGKQFFSKSLEWSIYFCVLTYMFNHKYRIRPAFYMDPTSLRRRFTVCAVAHAVFMPFLLFFMTLHFSMQNLYDWKSSKQYLGPREWSHVAKWTFREFNELPHAYERRLGPSYNAAENYLKLFTKSPVVVSLGRTLVFISGSLGAVLLALAAVNDSILLHVKLGHWNLLWYVGILGVSFSVGKAMLPDATVHPPYIHNLFAEMDSALAAVATHTHYYPDIWKGRGWDKQTQQAFSAMIQYKVKLFVMELVSVVLAPLVLCISFPKCADDLCSFVQRVKIEVPGAGDVCGYSTFDFDTFEDENWEGRKIQTGAHAGYDPEMINLSARPKTLQGKMEKSFFGFKAAHPSWKCSSSGQDLIDRVESYQHQQAIALAKERNHHIEAAARQLETLRKLEQRRLDLGNNNTPVNNIEESYIAEKASISEADAGAHCGGVANQVKGATSEMQSAEKNTVGGGVSSSSSHHTSHRVHFEDNSPSQSISDSVVPPMSARLGRLSSTAPTASSSSALPPFGVLSGARSPSQANLPAATSVLHYADTALSTELLRILNRSTLDPDQSGAGSILGAAFDHSILSLSNIDTTLGRRSNMDDDDEALERNAHRQYMWLERYHSHLSAQQKEQKK